MRHSGFAGHIGVARQDITPPVGIFFRNWGAAKHDAAEGIHRPLTLTALALQQDARSEPLVLIDADMGGWSHLTFERRFRARLLAELKLDAKQLIFGSTHSHSTPRLCEPEPQWKGGELLPAYGEKFYQAAVAAAQAALAAGRPAILEWHTGRCGLARNRDLPESLFQSLGGIPSPTKTAENAGQTDKSAHRLVCGFNPGGPADNTLLVGRVSDTNGKILATIVNYACHPTTLAWQNTMVSPDYVGAMRETLAAGTNGAPAMFLQGASGELAPRYQYTGDPAVADAHGRQVAFAALATLQDMEPPGQELVPDRMVESGAPLATWKRRETPVSRELRAAVRSVDLPLKDWPKAAELERQYKSCEDRALAERLRRKWKIREGLGDAPAYPLEIWGWRIGDALLVGSLVEAYSVFQQRMRGRFPERAVVCMNLINGSVGYLPPAALYDQDVYQVWQTPFERGGLEALTEGAEKLLQELLGDAMPAQE